jgi:hypothetical protein
LVVVRNLQLNFGKVLSSGFRLSLSLLLFRHSYLDYPPPYLAATTKPKSALLSFVCEKTEPNPLGTKNSVLPLVKRLEMATSKRPRNQQSRMSSLQRMLRCAFVKGKLCCLLLTAAVTAKTRDLLTMQQAQHCKKLYLQGIERFDNKLRRRSFMPVSASTGRRVNAEWYPIIGAGPPRDGTTADFTQPASANTGIRYTARF